MRRSLAILTCILFIFISAISLSKLGSWRISKFDQHEIKTKSGTYEISLPCNRWHNLMVALHITPPLPVNIFDQPYTSGVATIKYGNEALGKEVDLKKTGGYYSGSGLWKQPIIYIPGEFFRLCPKRTITITIEDLGIDLKNHKVLLYVMKDGRP